jgi:hypothetical protein
LRSAGATGALNTPPSELEARAAFSAYQSVMVRMTELCDKLELSMVNRSTSVTNSMRPSSKSGGQNFVRPPFGHRCRNRRSFSSSRTRRVKPRRADPRSSADLRRFHCTWSCSPRNRAHGRLVCSKSAARQNYATKRTNRGPTRWKTVLSEGAIAHRRKTTVSNHVPRNGNEPRWLGSFSKPLVQCMSVISTVNHTGQVSFVKRPAPHLKAFGGVVHQHLRFQRPRQSARFHGVPHRHVLSSYQVVHW